MYNIARRFPRARISWKKKKNVIRVIALIGVSGKLKTQGLSWSFFTLWKVPLTKHSLLDFFSLNCLLVWMTQINSRNSCHKFLLHFQGCGLTFLKLKIPILVADLHNNRCHYLYSYMLKEICGIRWQTVVQAVGGLGLDPSSPPFCALRPSLNQELNQ